MRWPIYGINGNYYNCGSKTTLSTSIKFLALVSGSFVKGANLFGTQHEFLDSGASFKAVIEQPTFFYGLYSMRFNFHDSTYQKAPLAALLAKGKSQINKKRL